MKAIKIHDFDFWAIKSRIFQRDDQHERSRTILPLIAPHLMNPVSEQLLILKTFTKLLYPTYCEGRRSCTSNEMKYQLYVKTQSICLVLRMSSCFIRMSDILPLFLLRPILCHIPTTSGNRPGIFPPAYSINPWHLFAHSWVIRSPVIWSYARLVFCLTTAHFIYNLDLSLWEEKVILLPIN